MIERTADGLRVTVPMVMANATALLDAGRAAFNQPQETIDLGAVEKVDSSALAILLAWQRTAEIDQRQIRIINLPAEVSALADLYGVDEFLSFA